MELFEAITGQPGEVVRCRTIDLVVPADASIVIEGYLHPARTAQDGPSPGPTMLFTPYASPQPVFEVAATTMRARPIYRHHQMTPFTDHQEMPRLFHEAILYERLRAMGMKVHDVHFPQAGGALSGIIQIEPSFEGQVTDALLAVLGSPWPNTKRCAVRPLHPRRSQPRRTDHPQRARRYLRSVGSPSSRGFADIAQTRHPSVNGKWAIDATKPVPYRAAERKNYERAWPMGWGKVRLEDYLT